MLLSCMGDLNQKEKKPKKNVLRLCLGCPIKVGGWSSYGFGVSLFRGGCVLPVVDRALDSWNQSRFRKRLQSEGAPFL